jgi:hypothetical protein
MWVVVVQGLCDPEHRIPTTLYAPEDEDVANSDCPGAGIRSHLIRQTAEDLDQAPSERVGVELRRTFTPLLQAQPNLERRGS